MYLLKILFSVSFKEVEAAIKSLNRKQFVVHINYFLNLFIQETPQNSSYQHYLQIIFNEGIIVSLWSKSLGRENKMMKSIIFDQSLFYTYLLQIICERVLLTIKSNTYHQNRRVFDPERTLFNPGLPNIL